MVSLCGWWEPEGVTTPTGDPPATPHRHEPPGHPPAAWGLGDVAGGVVAAQALSIVAVGIVFAATGWQSLSDSPIWAIGVLQIPLWLGLTGAVVVAGRAKGNGVVVDFGLRMAPLDAPVGIVVGVASQMVLLPVLYWPVLHLLGRSSDELSEPAEELAGRADGAAGWIVLAVMVVVAAPLVEELFYRGLVLGSMTKRGWPPWLSVVASAALFAAMHFQPLQFIGLFAFGIVLAVLCRLYGRLGPAIWAHAGFNATTVVALYLSAN